MKELKSSSNKISSAIFWDAKVVNELLTFSKLDEIINAVKENRYLQKATGGLVEGPEVPFTKEDPADRVDPFTGLPYQEQMDRLGFRNE